MSDYDDLLELDNTERTDYVSCPRKYQNRWLRKILSTKGSTALRYGVGWHGCMEGYYGHVAEHGWTRDGNALKAGAELGQEEFWHDSQKLEFRDDYRTVENMLRAFVLYLDHFVHDEGMMDIIETEKIFKILVQPTPIEERLFPGIRPFWFTGRMDTEVRLNGRPWLLEHKTTGQALSLQAQRLHRSTQVIGYNYAALSFLEEIPDGSLVVLHHLSAYKSKKTGQYGNPKIDFQRVPQVFAMDDLANFRLGMVRDAWNIQRSIASDYFPMCHYSCYTYGACTYINLCEQNRRPEEEILEGYFIDEDPWRVTKVGQHKLIVIEKEDTDLWQENQQKILSSKLVS